MNKHLLFVSPIAHGLMGVFIAALSIALIQGAVEEFSPKTISWGLCPGLVAGFIVFVVSFCHNVLQEGKSFFPDWKKRVMNLISWKI